MTKFFALLVLGLAACVTFAWLRRRRRGKKSDTIVKPDTVLQVVVQEEALKPPAGAKLGISTLSPDERAVLSDSGDTVTQPVGHIQINAQPVDSKPGEWLTDETEQPASTKNPVPAESAVKEQAEVDIVAEAEAPKSNPIVLPEKSDHSSAPNGQTETAIILPLDLMPKHNPKEQPPPVKVPAKEKPATNAIPHAPTYRPTAPAAPGARRPANPRPTQNANTELRLRLQLQFGRGGAVRNVALLPDRRDGMPTEIEVAGTQGKLNLVELREDCYEAVPLLDASNALLQGAGWNNNAGHCRWVLGGRELYVLAPGDEFGLCGFISTPRLRLNARHVVLATARLRDEVLLALTAAGCNAPEINDELSGAPTGWLLFRNVIPTRPVQRNERDIFNALRPAHDIEPHFIGGIRLERNSWLTDFPPRIQFTGEFANSFQVMIDGQSACQTTDGAFETSGWDSEGEHRLWFGDRVETYSIRTMEEDWQPWHAHDFGTGVAICGASTRQLDSARRQQVRVPTSNPVLVGSHPGEIFRCDLRNDMRCETVLKMIPFAPVWALPMDSAHADKKSARILLFRPAEPVKDIQSPIRNVAARLVWISVIREAGSKGLSIAPDDAASKALWQRYRIVAKQLRRRMR